MSSSSQLRMLALIAVRSLRTHRVTSLIVGSIVLFGTFLVVLGTALLDSIEASMARSITSSFVGHIQVHAAGSRDELAVFGSGFMGDADIGELRDFARVRAAVESVPNVAAVVPMGQTIVQVASENAIDEVVGELRRALTDRDEERIAALEAQVRGIAADLTKEYENRRAVSTKADELDSTLVDLARVRGDALWAELRADPEPSLLFLETKLAPLYEEAQLIYLRVLGTDLARFPKLFDRFKLASGEPVPGDGRGLLISSYMYERFLKNKAARDLDKLKRARDEQGKRIADDPLLADLARQLPAQYQRVTFQLEARAAHGLHRDLEGFLGHPGELNTLVQELLTVTDASFDARYAFFYEKVAPHIRLYAARVGDVVTLRGITKSGYMKSVNVKLYGIFQFEGLETSDLAGSQNLVDLMTFRDLYGIMTPERQRELSGIKAEVGLAEVSRERAEEELFGGASVVGERREAGKGFDELTGLDVAAARQRAASVEAQRFTAQEVDAGLARSAAVLLRDVSRLEETRVAIEEASRAAGVPLRAVDWQKAAGIVGQFIIVVRLVLYVAIFIIFLVALVIINNSMVMATMERVAEIGTMRAIGAQRGFVMALFLVETLVLGLASGVLGAALGAGVVALFGQVGIPASSDVMAFLFSGPRLYPQFGVQHLVVGVFAVLAVSAISTFYPARIATGIQPVVAMQVKE